jgi:hypothetical protein
MMYKTIPFQSLIDLQPIVHIIVFFMKKYKIMYKMMQLISNFLYKKTTWFPLCNYMFIGLIWWKNKSYENFKILKFWNKWLQGKWFFYYIIWFFKNIY